MKRCDDVGKLAEELGVSRGALYLWKRRTEGLPSYRDAARRGHPPAEDDQQQANTIRELEAKIASLEGELGRRRMEASIHCRGVGPAERRAWRDCIYDEIRGWESQREKSIQRMCELGGSEPGKFLTRTTNPTRSSETSITTRTTVITPITGAPGAWRSAIPPG